MAELMIAPLQTIFLQSLLPHYHFWFASAFQRVGNLEQAFEAGHRLSLLPKPATQSQWVESWNLNPNRARFFLFVSFSMIAHSLSDWQLHQVQSESWRSKCRLHEQMGEGAT